jgi:hypothetical protein
MEIKKFIKGKTYLKLIMLSEKSKKRAIYKCEVCDNIKEINIKLVENLHDRTCGCMNNHSNSLDLNLTKEGYALTKTNMDVSCKIGKGYKAINIYGKTIYLHRAIANKFIPNPNNYTDVNHINGIKHDNRVENLEWCTRSYNVKHAILNGLNTGSTGVKSSNRKITKDEDINFIKNSKLTLKELGLKFGVSKTSISNLKNNKTYNI